MPIYSITRELPLPPEPVFDFLADPRNLLLWNSGVEDVRDPADGPGAAPEQGAQYHYRFPGRHKFHRLTCHFFKPPHLIAYRGQRMWNVLGTQTPTFLFYIRPAPGGRSTLLIQVDLKLGGGMLAMWPVVALGWRRDLPDDVDRLHETLAPLADAFAPAAEPAPGADVEAAPALADGQDDPMEPAPAVRRGTAFA